MMLRYPDSVGGGHQGTGGRLGSRDDRVAAEETREREGAYPRDGATETRG